MSDKPSVEVSLDVNSPPERAWSLVTDLAAMGRWSPEYQGGEWIEGAEAPAVGARFRGRSKRGEREWETVSTVVEADAPRVFAFAVGDPANAAATWRFELSPAGDGTRITQRVMIGPGPSGLTAVIDRFPDREEEFVDGRREEHRRNMQQTLEGLKAEAEPEARSAGGWA